MFGENIGKNLPAVQYTVSQLKWRQISYCFYSNKTYCISMALAAHAQTSLSCLKHTALDRLRVHFNVVLLMSALHWPQIHQGSCLIIPFSTACIWSWKQWTFWAHFIFH